ncbi:hypothetical protein A0H81_14459 [Grifola frondosa]|uniref:Uncharacterized protein n=1 Tax=Grifola frondosa TaxID=5627 RepID=A0A1C7LM80_GRIFR|nr:hypothetical protein A0H81_14459 [Grifola frondosa]
MLLAPQSKGSSIAKQLVQQPLVVLLAYDPATFHTGRPFNVARIIENDRIPRVRLRTTPVKVDQHRSLDLRPPVSAFRVRLPHVQHDVRCAQIPKYIAVLVQELHGFFDVRTRTHRDMQHDCACRLG